MGNVHTRASVMVALCVRLGMMLRNGAFSLYLSICRPWATLVFVFEEPLSQGVRLQLIFLRWGICPS